MEDYSLNDSYYDNLNMTMPYDDDMYALIYRLRMLYSKIDFYMKRVGFGIGLGGNIIVVVICYRTRYFRDGPNVYLTAQFVLHLLYILTTFFKMLDVTTGNNANNIHFFCILYTNVLFIFNFLSNWLVVLYAGFWLRRAHRHPPQRRLSPNMMYPSCNCPHLGILVALGCTGLVFYFHLWWMTDGCKFLESWLFFIQKWRRADMYLNSFLPRLLILIILPALIFYYCRARRWLANATNLINERSQGRRHNIDDRNLMEPLVIALPLLTTLLCLPRELILLVTEVYANGTEMIYTCLGFADILMEVSFVVKFLLPFIFSPKFRAAFLCCKRRRRSSSTDDGPLSTQTCFANTQPGTSGPTPV